MSYVEQLESELRSIVEAFDAEPPMKRLLAGDITLDHYRSFVQQNYYPLRERSLQLALAAARLRAAPDVTKLLHKHAVQEIGHELLALEDYKALGGDPSAVPGQDPLPETLALIATIHYQITHLNPVGFLGCLAFTDYTPISAPERYHEAMKRIGLPDEASNLFRDRQLLGPRHAALLTTYAEELVEAERDVEAVVFGMRNTATLFANMIGAAFDAVDGTS